MHLYSLGGSGMYYDRTENLYLKMTMLDDVIKSMLNVTRLFLISNTFVSNARLKLDLFETRILKRNANHCLSTMPNDHTHPE